MTEFHSCAALRGKMTSLMMLRTTKTSYTLFYVYVLFFYFYIQMILCTLFWNDLQMSLSEWMDEWGTYKLLYKCSLFTKYFPAACSWNVTFIYLHSFLNYICIVYILFMIWNKPVFLFFIFYFILLKVLSQTYTLN